MSRTVKWEYRSDTGGTFKSRGFDSLDELVHAVAKQAFYNGRDMKGSLKGTWLHEGRVEVVVEEVEIMQTRMSPEELLDGR